jgi:hypothetical protein
LCFGALYYYSSPPTALCQIGGPALFGHDVGPTRCQTLDLAAAKLAVAQAGGSAELAAATFFQSLDDSGGSGDDDDGISESLPPGSFQIGQRVTIKPDVAEVRELQAEEHGGWEVDMGDYCGQSGEVFQVFPDGDCKVVFDTGRRLCWNPCKSTINPPLSCDS